MESSVETLIFYAFYIHWHRRRPHPHPHTRIHTAHFYTISHSHTYKYIYNHYSCFKNNLSNVTTSLVHDFILMALLQWIRERTAIHAYPWPWTGESSDFKAPHWIFAHVNEYVHIFLSHSPCLSLSFFSSCFTPLQYSLMSRTGCRHVRFNFLLRSFPPASSICSQFECRNRQSHNANAFQHVYFRYSMLDVLDAFVFWVCCVSVMCIRDKTITSNSFACFLIDCFSTEQSE